MKKPAVVERVKKLQDSNGRVTPEIILADAKDPRSPLHGEFEWDKDKASEKYWLEQARQLIRTVQIQIEVREIQITIPMYVRDPSAQSHEQGYRNVVHLRDDKQLAHEALTNEFMRAAAMLARAKNLALAFDLESVFVDLLEKVEKTKIIIEEHAPIN